VDPSADEITDIGLKVAAAASEEARRAILALVKKNGLTLDDLRLHHEIEDILKGVQPTLEKILAETSVAAAVRGVDDVLKLAPNPPGGWPNEPPDVPITGLLFPDDKPPIVRFPALEAAARRISTARVIEPT